MLNIVQKACKATALGFRIRPDFSARKMYFEVYKGADWTVEGVPNVIFSEKYDNLMEERYTYDSTNYKTKAFASQLINDVRVAYDVGGGTGLDLRELHVPTNVDTDGRTTAQIKSSMETQGQRALESHIVLESFVFATDADAPFEYRTDYDVGDQCRVHHVAWGINLALRVAEIEEDYENSGREILLTCGSPLPEIIDFEEG